jgi:hypothetical protein
MDITLHMACQELLADQISNKMGDFKVLSPTINICILWI